MISELDGRPLPVLQSVRVMLGWTPPAVARRVAKIALVVYGGGSTYYVLGTARWTLFSEAEAMAGDTAEIWGLAWIWRALKAC